MDRDSRKKQEDQKVQPSVAKAYIENIRQFLTNFKTTQCDLNYEHDYNSCQFHHGSDMRRNPYLEHSFAYYPSVELLQQALRNSNLSQDMLCHNNTQQLYHPIVYKTQRCANFYNCPLHFVCSNLHSQDQKYFEYGEFFRFDIRTHKTKPCLRRDFHERKTCIYYHNETDRRRANFDTYSHELCFHHKCNDQNCHNSHNKIEQVYHPNRYKSKFCKTYTNKNIRCDFKQFCAFAHTQAEIKIQMIHLLNRDYDFYLQKYKTVWCPDTLTHDRSGCVYAHNIQDFRRNPFKYNYQPEKCQFWNFDDELKSLQDSGCKAGMNCDKCHGWMEQRYHPLILKKSKLNEFKDASTIIEKKIKNVRKESKQANQKISKIEQVVDEKVSEIAKSQPNGAIRQVGAPFFKKDTNNSDSSRKTNGLTTNFESDDSVRQQNNGNPKPELSKGQTRCATGTRKKSFFFTSEQPQEEIWRCNFDQRCSWIEKKHDQEQERARSQNKFDDCETVYSHSLKQAVDNNSILKKLKNNNIHELRLKNLSQSEIDQFAFLNKQEKDQLNHKIKVYQLRRERNPVTYTIELTKFFISRKKEIFLEKAKAKKIKQQKLLSMKRKQIEKFEFLSKGQQEELSKLISEYKKFRNEQEFSQINHDISRFVSPKRSPHKS